MVKKEETKLPVKTPEDTKQFIEKFLSYWNHYAKHQPSWKDLMNISDTAVSLHVSFSIDHEEYGFRYLYFLKPETEKDRRILLSNKALVHFAAKFGFPDILIYEENNFVVLDLPGTENYLYLADILHCDEYYNAQNLKVAVGKDFELNSVFLDLDNVSCLSVVGGEDSGKSMFLHQLVLSLLINHFLEEIHFEIFYRSDYSFEEYNSISNVTAKQLSAGNKPVAEMLENLCCEMEDRFERINLAGCNNISSYNKIADTPLQHIIVIVDEYNLPDQRYGDQIESSIKRLSGFACYCGIHIIFSTRSADFLPDSMNLKNHAKICMAVKNEAESIKVLGVPGGEKLSGEGDLLIKINSNQKSIRCQAGDIGYDDIKNVVAALNGEKAYRVDLETEERENEAGNGQWAENTIKKVQEALIKVGYDCEPADGVVRDNTQLSIKQYQENNGLAISGVINNKLLASLKIN